jgi:hypothetical protein
MITKKHNFAFLNIIKQKKKVGLFEEGNHNITQSK